MKLKFLQNISFLRASGADGIVAVEVYSSFVKLCYIKNRKPLRKISGPVSLSDFEIVKAKYDSIKEYGDIKRALEIFAESNKIKEPQILIGLNEYKFTTASVPNDVEDINIWFDENLKKFLPEGRPPDEFNLVFDKYFGSENYNNFAVDVARSDYLSKVLEACKIKNSVIIAAFPFPLSFISGSFANETDSLYIDLSDSKITYAFREKGGKAYIGEIYKNIYEDSGEGLKIFDLQRIDETVLNESMQEMRNIIENSFGIRGAAFDVYISCSSPSKELIERAIKDVFGDLSINKDASFDPFYTGAAAAACKIYGRYEETSYHLPQEMQSGARFELEKKLTLNFILAGGLILIMLMLVSLGANTFLNSKISEDEETVSLIEARNSEYESTLKENKKLKDNIASITSLRKERQAYSGLLRDLSDLMPQGCALSELKLKNLEKGGIRAEIKGEAASQAGIAEFIEYMESSGKFKNVSLLFSNAADIKNNEEGGETKSLLQFGISAGYYEN
ncbi:MAG TPA: PilN domain-containing protein [Ignavibacteriales bacterium]|nr:PilN domain-containing protein [Ignavibacteriales bacterium]